MIHTPGTFRYPLEPIVETKNQLVVKVDRDLEDITPGYLENRKKDLLLLPRAVAEKEFETLKMIGHRMKGSGAGYGFQFISDIGTRLEQAAKRQDLKEVQVCIEQLADYLNRVEVVYL